MTFNFDWSQLFTLKTVVNVLDILIVAFFFYQLLKFFQNSRANQLIKGIAVIILIKLFSSFFGLQTTEWLIDIVIQWSAIALIVIFQPELRRGLERIGRGNLFERRKEAEPTANMIDDLVTASRYMARRKIGALISIERKSSMNEFIQTGIPMSSEISSELLINLFVPNTPLHDGAVIIKDFKIASAASYLPLSDSASIPKKYGTRHRAAVGLSEDTDALTIVVSEETGGVSVTSAGQIISDLTDEDLRNFLTKNLVFETEEEKNWYERIIDQFKGGDSDDE